MGKKRHMKGFEERPSEECKRPHVDRLDSRLAEFRSMVQRSTLIARELVQELKSIESCETRLTAPSHHHGNTVASSSVLGLVDDGVSKCSHIGSSSSTHHHQHTHTSRKPAPTFETESRLSFAHDHQAHQSETPHINATEFLSALRAGLLMPGNHHQDHDQPINARDQQLNSLKKRHHSADSPKQRPERKSSMLENFRATESKSDIMRDMKSVVMSQVVSKFGNPGRLDSSDSVSDSVSKTSNTDHVDNTSRQEVHDDNDDDDDDATDKALQPMDKVHDWEGADDGEEDSLLIGSGGGGGGAMQRMPSPWPTNIVPFVVDPSFLDHQRRNILLAFNQYHDNTCVRFKPREQERDFVYIRRVPDESEPCTSNLGYQGGQQTITLNDKCAALKGTILHELMHVLGFDHEQSRKDRDKYVHVNWENILPGYERNFRQRQHMTDLNYDYGSIMHYPPYAFADEPSVPTLVPKMDFPLRMIGQRFQLSNLDQHKINQIYRCDRHPVRPSSYYPTEELRAESYMPSADEKYWRVVGAPQEKRYSDAYSTGTKMSRPAAKACRSCVRQMLQQVPTNNKQQPTRRNRSGECETAGKVLAPINETS